MFISSSSNEDAKILVQKCVKIASAFDKFQKMKSDDIKEDDLDLDIVLPYIVLHAKDNRNIFKKFQNKSPSFRVQSMISIFTSQEEPINETDFSNINLESYSDGQKLSFFKMDLELAAKGENCKIFSLNNFSRYLSDIFPILYNRYKSQFPFKAFIHALMFMTENAVIATCFAFPQFIMPMFNKTSSFSIKAQLSVMSSSFRPILLGKLIPNPYVVATLIIEYLGQQAPEYLLYVFDCDFNELAEPMQPLLRANYQSKAFYLCIARFCACGDRSIRDSEVDKMLKCNDSKLLAALFFYLRIINLNKMGQIVDRFLLDKESFIDLMTFYCAISSRDSNKVSNLMIQYLGPAFTQYDTTAFYHELTNRKHQLIGYLSQNALDHPNALAFLGSLMPQNSDTLKDMMAPAMFSLKTITNLELGTFFDFIQKFSYVEQLPDVVEDIIKQKPFFEIDSIRKNPAPATAAAMLILCLPLTNKSKQLLQKVPIRLILAACNRYDVYYAFCQAVYKTFSFAEDEPFMSLAMEDIKPSMPLLDVLHKIKTNPSEITKETLDEWKIHHFLNSFNFVIQTLQCLGAPMNLSNLQFVFEFDQSILCNEYSLKIIFICVLDIISVDSSVVEESVILLLFDAIDHFADSRFDRPIIGWFIGVLLRKPKRYFILLDKGIKDTVLTEFGEFVKFTDTMADNMKKAAENINSPNLTQLLNIIKFARAFVHQSPQNVIIPVSAIIKRLNSAIFEAKDPNPINFSQEWIIDFCSNLSVIAIAIPSIHNEALTTITRFSDFYGSILSSEANSQILKLKNSMTASLFNIDL